MTRDGGRPDVLVVGAGPSGSALALLMARRGWAVTVVDRAQLPRAKPCGEFISPGAIRALERLQLRLPTPQGGSLQGWNLQVDDVGMSKRFELGPGASMPRERLDGALGAQARAAGALFLERSTYLGGGPGIGSPDVRIRTPEGVRVLRPGALVGAGGLRCPVARSLRRGASVGAPRKISLTAHVAGVTSDPRFGRLIVRGDLTVGLAPSDPGGAIWNATVVVPASEGSELKRKGVTPFFLERVSRAGIPGQIRLWGGPPAASSGFRIPSGPTFTGRTVTIGDSQGYFDPFTGQGIYQALRSAELLAPWLHLALSRRRPWDQALAGYRRQVVREKRRTQRLQRAVEAWLSSGPFRPALTRVLARVPGLFSAIMEATTDQSPLGRAIHQRVKTAWSAKDSAGEALAAPYLERGAQNP